MVNKTLVLAASAAAFLAASALPASAQFADFFCDTFTVGCRPPPPPPPPALAPVEEPTAPVKKPREVHKPKARPKKAAADAAAPDAAPK